MAGGSAPRPGSPSLEDVPGERLPVDGVVQGPPDANVGERLLLVLNVTHQMWGPGCP